MASSNNPSLGTPHAEGRLQTDIGQDRHPPFLMWYDDNPKTPIINRIRAAITAYQTRFPGTNPTLVLVSITDHPGLPPAIDGISIQRSPTVLPNTYWVGQQSGLATG